MDSMDSKMQRFIDLFVQNFQPEPKQVGDVIVWYSKNSKPVDWLVVSFEDEETVWWTRYSENQSFVFDGSAESIPERLVDVLFTINGFTEPPILATGGR